MASASRSRDPGGKVVLLGSDGVLGPHLLHQLVINNFEVTVLKRAGSKAPDIYPSTVKLRKISDDYNVNDLIAIFTGQDAVIVSIRATQIALQKRIADAAALAGVKHYIPGDFGSCDSATQRAQELVPLFKYKTELRDHLTDLAKRYTHFKWTALVTGHLFDWLEFVKVFLDEKKISILDSGNVKASYSTRDRVGEATVHVLQRPDQTANKVLFVQSFCVDQREIMAAFEQATDSTWTVEHMESIKYEHDEILKRDQGDHDAIENLVWLLGVMDGDWPKKEAFAMDLLDLKDEDLNHVVSKIVEQHAR